MPVSDFLQIVIPKFSEDDASTLANHLEALGHIPIIITKKTRAISLNEGAIKTTSDYILFLHADSKIEDDTIENLINYIKARNVDGMYYFSLKFDNGKILRLNSIGANLRSLWFSLPYGDQGFCISRKLFMKTGGFPENVNYGEDLYFVLKLKKMGISILNNQNYIITSSRKYLNNGWLITTLQHQWRLLSILFNFYFKRNE
ncbi:MAG: glycosyltransferase [Pseudomonadota bacterium]|nr:glycosyltransferase [Pseudomonadota bacterium]